MRIEMSLSLFIGWGGKQKKKKKEKSTRLLVLRIFVVLFLLYLVSKVVEAGWNGQQTPQRSIFVILGRVFSWISGSSFCVQALPHQKKK